MGIFLLVAKYSKLHVEGYAQPLYQSIYTELFHYIQMQKICQHQN